MMQDNKKHTETPKDPISFVHQDDIIVIERSFNMICSSSIIETLMLKEMGRWNFKE